MTTDLPTPKYRIGDAVWAARCEREKTVLPCPDCLGSKKWELRTPAGAVIEVGCQRCAGDYLNNEKLSLVRWRFAPSAQRLTIGSVRLDTANSYGDKIEYMCVETGVGSGSIYGETKLFATEQDAIAAATISAGIANDKIDAEPEAVRQAIYSGFRFVAAHLKAHNDAVWDAWYAYRRLREDLEELLQEDEKSGGLSEGDWRESVRDKLNWERKFRDLPDVGEILALLNAAAEGGDVTPLKNVLSRFTELREFIPAREKTSACEQLESAEG